MAAPYRGRTLRISGIKETKENLEKLMRVGFDGDVIYKAIHTAIEPIAKQAKANIAPYSQSVAASIFIASKRPNSRPRKKTGLVVLHKADTMREWNAAPGNTSPRAKVIPWVRDKLTRKVLQRGNRSGQWNNNAVAESLATMFELGTSRRWLHGAGMKAHFWFRNAVDQVKAEVAAKLKSGLLEIIEETVRQMGVNAPSMTTPTPKSSSSDNRPRDSRGRFI